MSTLSGHSKAEQKSLLTSYRAMKAKATAAQRCSVYCTQPACRIEGCKAQSFTQQTKGKQ